MAETDAKLAMVGPEEMAAFFSRSVKTWRRWVRTGRAPLPDQVIGAAWYYPGAWAMMSVSARES